MSASTVSITANPTTGRRRPVVEKRTKIGLVGDDGFIPQFNGDGGGGDDKVSGGVGGGKDLNRSIGGESILERSRDLMQVKKTLATTTVSPRRTRKVVEKQEKPRWITVVSVFTKNFLLLVVVLGFVQVIRKLVLNHGDNLVGTNSVEISDFEKRIAEAESLLKTTTKMMQAQVEVVDKKIEYEIGGLRRELTKKIEDNGVMFEEGLKKMEGRTEGLEKSLGELRDMNLMSKEEFDKFYIELKDRAVGYGDRDVSLDDIRASLREMIEKEFEKHGADGLGRVDYALASGGAMVVKHSEPFIVGKGSGWLRKGTSRNGVSSEAEKMLRPSFGEPGQCFPLKGSTGFVQVRLRTAIIPEAITLEHVSKSVAYDRSSAPKDCRVSGWLQDHNTDLAVEVEMFSLAEFTYDLEKSNIQTFNVLEAAGSGIVNTIRFDFTSNHGSTSHTCIYRLRVHGHEPSSVSMSVMQS